MMIGSTVSHYRILEKIGSGGMGEVYLAEDTKLERKVALKFLPRHLTADKEARERFKREAKAAAALNHPNIVTVYEIGEHEGQVFIAMEYVEGQTLKELISSVGARRDAPSSGDLSLPIASSLLPLAQVLDIATQLASGLAAAHEKGIVHRDVKPQNIVVDKDNHVKILDFGLAKLKGVSPLTKEASTLGTVHYMSPEQAIGKEVDHRTDIWSFGVVLHEMLTGELPFAGEYEQAVIYAIINDPSQPPSHLSPGVPAEMDALTGRMLEKRADNRPQQVSEVLSELQRLKTSIGEKRTPNREIQRPAIAVLPFKNISADPGNEYFGDGLAEELINALTQVKGLRVAARTSAFHFKGKEMDIREIGRQLGVDKVLEGSVRKAGKNLRITAQLINVADGFHLWSERFDRQHEDIFAIQDEISLTIVDKMKLSLLAGEKERVVKRHTQSKGAYDLFLKGRYFWNRRYKGDMIKAVAFFQRAIDKDPSYALPYVGIADVFNIFGLWSFIRPHQAYAKSREMLQRALAIDDTLAEAYSSLGMIVLCHDRDFAAADLYFRRAIELNPHCVMAHAWYTMALAAQHQFAGALAEIRLAVEDEPLMAIPNAMNGVMHVLSGQTEKGREMLRQAIALDPAQPMTYLFMGMTCLTTPSVPEQGIHYLRLADQAGIPFALGWLGLAYAMAGRRQEAERMLERLEKMDRESYLSFFKKLVVSLHPALKHFRAFKNKYGAPLLKFLVLIGLERQEEALSSLEESFRQRDYFLPVVTDNLLDIDLPWLDKLRSDPRYLALWAGNP